MKYKKNKIFSKILKEHNISLAITSYHSDKLLFLKHDSLISYSFKRPMGMYIDDGKLIIGTHSHIYIYSRNNYVLKQIKSGSLDDETKFTDKILEKDKEEFEQFKEDREIELKSIKDSDTLFIPRSCITTGMINIHDISFGANEVWMINTTFSCISILNYDYSFIARWKPSFISKLVPEDRCHLNGMAMLNGRPKYVTTFNVSDEKDFWKKETTHNGTLIDVDTNEILLDSLIMPHSPKCYKNNVYFCESGKGTVLRFDPITKKLEEVIRLQGFTRGISFYGTLMFVGLSKMRASWIKNPIPLTQMYDKTLSGIWVIDLNKNKEVAHFEFNNIDQVYEVAIIEKSNNPELLDNSNGLVQHIFDYKEEIEDDFSKI